MTWHETFLKSINGSIIGKAIYLLWFIGMPRLGRINFKNAFYHVMNRGIGRQAIFHVGEASLMFLACRAGARGRGSAVPHISVAVGC